jgi:glucosamine-6-phosphate deaminase
MTPSARRTRYEQLEVEIHPSNEALGRAAAAQAAGHLRAALAARSRANVVFACANSMLTFLSALRAAPDLDWSRIHVFHMDEYLGMPDSHPASFRRFLREKLLNAVRPAAFHGIAGETADPAGECRRYAGLLRASPPDVCCLGIGENGHLAFNDPPYADFDDPEQVKIVALDEVSRRQQVGEGHFPTLRDVPTHAITLTIPALLAAAHVVAVVPELRKAAAVKASLTGPLTVNCPGSILRKTPHARLFLDVESASLLEESQP